MVFLRSDSRQKYERLKDRKRGLNQRIPKLKVPTSDRTRNGQRGDRNDVARGSVHKTLPAKLQQQLRCLFTKKLANQAIGLASSTQEQRQDFSHIKVEPWFLTKFLTCTTAITKQSRQGLDHIPVTRRLKFLSNFKLTKMKISQWLSLTPKKHQLNDFRNLFWLWIRFSPIVATFKIQKNTFSEQKNNFCTLRSKTGFERSLDQWPLLTILELQTMIEGF